MSDYVKISSARTPFYKKTFPVIWFGLLGVMFLIGILSVFDSGSINSTNIAFLVIPVVLAIFGYGMLKYLVFNLVDEVYYDHRSLLVRNGKLEEVIDFLEIKNVKYLSYSNPSRVMVSLKGRTAFGRDKILFSPEGMFPQFLKDRKVEQLIARINNANNSEIEIPSS